MPKGTDLQTELDRDTTPDTSTRDRLIAATLELIDQRGTTEVKINDVVERAGTTTGSLYWFFKNRQHLINSALAERYVAHMRMVVDRIAEVAQSSDEPIPLLATATFDVSEKTRVDARHRQIRALADALEDPDLGREIAQIQREFLKQATTLIERAQAAGQVRTDLDAYSLALFSQSVTIGLAVADLSPDLMPDPQKWWYLTKVFLEGLS